MTFKDYEKRLDTKAKSLQIRLLNNIQRKAKAGIDESRYTGKKDVEIYADYEKGKATVTGSQVLFMEFGIGVNNESHPLQGEVEGIVEHGEYGQGKGKQKAWVYYGDPGNAGKVLKTDKKKGTLSVTHGYDANMFMYNALKDTVENLGDMAKDVFKN